MWYRFNPFLHINTLKRKSFGKTLWKKVKLLKMSNFTFFHNVFYAICMLKSFNGHISFVICCFFEFGTVSKWCIRDWVKECPSQPPDSTRNTTISENVTLNFFHNVLHQLFLDRYLQPSCNIYKSLIFKHKDYHEKKIQVLIWRVPVEKIQQVSLNTRQTGSKISLRIQ